MKSFAVLILCILVFPYNTGFSKKVKEEFCVSDQGSTTTCNNYLKAKKALNLSSEFFGVETDRSCRLRAKCGHRSLRMDPNAKCLCDTLCEHFKDCCADYRLWCRQKQPEQRKNNTEDCRSVHGQKKGGYIMVSSCPVTWTDDHIKQKCEDEASLDTMLTMLPVTDGIDFRIYKNIFCALCNKARKMAYWNITVQGNQGINRSLPFHENFPKINDWNATEPDSLQDKVRFCIPKFSGCRKDNSLAGLLRMNKEELERVCNSYAFPLCVKVPPNSLPSKVFKLRNLHCLLCALDDHSVRDQLRSTDSICNGYGISTTLPSQTVVFNFKSSFSSCKQDKIFDPFTGKCSDVRANHNEQTEKNKTQKSNETLTSNCIPTNFSLILGSRMIIVNGSVRPDMHIAVINNSSYVCWNETDKLRCIPEKYPYVKEDKQTLIVHTLTASQILIKVIDNTSYICRNKTAATVGRTVYGNGTERSDQFWVQVVTTIGFAASAFCIIFLLLTYSLFSELRTTPGKSVMSLTCALLVYMACYIPMTSTSYPILCIANAIVLHFSLLSMFFWFNVLAYDMTKRFGNGSKGMYKMALFHYDVMIVLEMWNKKTLYNLYSEKNLV